MRLQNTVNDGSLFPPSARKTEGWMDLPSRHATKIASLRERRRYSCEPLRTIRAKLSYLRSAQFYPAAIKTGCWNAMIGAPGVLPHSVQGPEADPRQVRPCSRGRGPLLPRAADTPTLDSTKVTMETSSRAHSFRSSPH